MIFGALSPLDVKVTGLPALWDAKGVGTKELPMLRIQVPHFADIGMYTITITVTDSRRPPCSRSLTITLDMRGAFGRERAVAHP